MLSSVILGNIFVVLVVIAGSSLLRRRWVVKDSFVYAVITAGVVDILLFIVFGPINRLLVLLIWAAVVWAAWLFFEKRT